MRHVSAVVHEIRTQSERVVQQQHDYRAKQNANAQLSAQAAQVVNQLFSELQAIFPAWRYAFPTDEMLKNAKKTWVKALVESRVTTLEQVQIGLSNARKSGSPHFPAVGQFIKWCRALENFGLPDERSAYLESCKRAHDVFGNWSHPAVYLAARETGFFELKSRTENETYPDFKIHYAKLCQKVMLGADFSDKLPVKRPALPAPAVISQEVARQGLASFRQRLGV